MRRDGDPVQVGELGDPLQLGDTAAVARIDPEDVDDLASALRRVVTDADFRRELRTRGLARAKQFTWERTAKETTAVYRRMADIA